MKTDRNLAGSENTEQNSIPAYFRNPEQAEKAISDLSAAGFHKQDIGVAIWDRSQEGGSTGWGQRLRSMFAPHERDEYESGNALEVLEHMGLSEDQGRYFKNALRSGGVLVTVNPRGRSTEAYAILRRSNALTSDNIGTEFAESREETTGQQRIQLLGETLRVHKER